MNQSRGNLFCLLSVVFTAGFSALSAQSLRFFARPAEVFEGDAVVFNYRTDVPNIVPLSQIRSWKWDFNGDGAWDEEKTVGDSDPSTGLAITAQQITTTWYATFDDTLAQDGKQLVKPTLSITYDDGSGVQPLAKTGITENTSGPAGVAPDPDEDLIIKSRSAGNADVIVNFTVNPRLAAHPVLSGAPVRLYSSVKPADGRTLVSSNYSWMITQTDGTYSTTSTSSNPTLSGLPVGSYDVSLTAFYSVTYKNKDGDTVPSPPGTYLVETKKDAFRVVEVPDSLTSGRAYRRGFPETFGWEDIMNAYQALGPGNNRYVYFNHFEDAFFSQQTQLIGDAQNAGKRQTMAEIVNESLQGQLLIANQRLADALRIKYPRLAADVDPDEDRLNPPAGARTETAAIDQALLDYQLPLYFAATAVQTLGTDILRVKAPEGAEPFPQFPQYLTITDPSLSQGPIPIKNEYWQLTTTFERMCLGRMEKAKKLYRLSVQDSAALGEAKEEAKNAGLHSYLGMAVLAAAQSEKDYQLNEGNSLLAHQKNALDLFERINAGINPLGNDGSFIPNESFAAIYQDAQEAVADAREAEINARQEDRLWESYQAELRNEHLAQRNNYLTPLKNLTSIDPALYNDLRTVDDQRDYRAVVQGRVDALLKDYPVVDPKTAGELGSNVIAVLDAAKGVDAAKNELANLYARVDLAKWGNSRMTAILKSTSEQFQNVDVLQGLVSGIIAAAQANGGWEKAIAAAGGVSQGLLSQQRTIIQTIQQVEINDQNMEKEIRGLLLEVGNLGIAIERAGNQFRQSQLALDNQLARMDRMIEDLAHTRETAADLYFQDPSFRVVVSQAMRRAESEMDFAVDRLYRLAKTLEYEWTEGYQNPITVPVNSQEPASLENPLFDPFTQTDSLFFVRGADEAKDYLDALKAWDSKLRRINVVSVRGPNHSGPITAEPISMRETILNLKPDATRGYTLDQSIRDFRNYLEGRRTDNYYNTINKSLEVPFATTIEDNRFFPATGSRWNMRVHSIAVDVYAESGFSNKQVAEIDLIQSGVVSLRRFFASPPLADDVTKLTQNVDNTQRTAFAIALPAKINGATGGRPLTEFENLGLKNRPVAATNWILQINTEGPTNQNIDFSKIKDIVIRYTYTFGNPEEFPNF